MWLLNSGTQTGRTIIRLTALFVLLASLSACGFRPLYGTSNTNKSVNNQLSAIEIARVKTRIAQQIRNQLITTMSPPGTQQPVRYRLEIFPFEWERNTLVRINADAARRIYNLRVTYKLFEIGKNKGMTSGSVLAVASYIRVTNEFANVRAKRNAENRAATATANDIKIRLAAYFAAR